MIMELGVMLLRSYLVMTMSNCPTPLLSVKQGWLRFYLLKKSFESLNYYTKHDSC